MLKQNSQWKLRVLVVWEPILATDWQPPSGSTLGRVSDARAQQFWDPHHEVSKALSRMAGLMSYKPRPNSKGLYWDEAIVYAPHSKWEDRPVPLFWQGAVYQVIPGLTTAVDESAAKIP